MTDTWEASFGDLDFSPAAQYGDVGVTVYGLRRGKHTRITAVADSLIQDGSIERVVRDDNRDVQLVLCLDGSDSEALAQYEATLFREVNRGRNEFRWTPPDRFGATAVFDVLWADLAFADEDTVWDLDEIRGRRNYVLTLRCLPFARSVDPFTAAGVTSGAATATLVDGGTSATGWSTGDGTTVTSDGDVLSVVGTMDFTGQTNFDRLNRTGLVDMTGTNLLTVDWKIEAGRGGHKIEMSLDGASASVAGESYATKAGYRRTHFNVVGSSFSSLSLKPRIDFSYGADPIAATFRVDKIERTSQAPSVGTLRQKVTTIDVPGSARTPASLTLTVPSGSLGNVLLYTAPGLTASTSPALSPFRQSGSIPDSTFVSGSKFDATSDVYTVPVAHLNSGLHQIVIRAHPASWTVTAVLQVDGVDVGTPVAGVASAELLAPDTEGLGIYTLGSIVLPPHEVLGSSAANVKVTVTGTGGTSPRVDETWAFFMPDDGTAHLSAITAGTRRRVQLDAATINSPHPACYVGNADDGSDAFGVDGATSNWDEHLMPAGPVNIFTVTTTALDAAVAATGHARWLTHPAA